MSERDEPRVLIIDDSHQVLEGMKLILEMEGYDVLTAEGGSQGLRVLNSLKFDAVLLDCRMPDIEGPEVCRLVRQGEGPNHRTPIIAMSINSRNRWWNECEEAGVDAFFEKSGDIELLIETLKSQVGSASDTGSQTG